MPAYKQFKEMWEEKITPIVEEYEPHRKKHRSALSVTALVTSIITFLFFVLSTLFLGDASPPLIVFFLGWFVVWAFVYSWLYKGVEEYYTEYKKRIINKMLAHTQFDWRLIDADEDKETSSGWKLRYLQSGMSPFVGDVLVSDEFGAEYNNMPLLMAQIEHRPNTKNSRRNQRKTIPFKGLFIVGEHERELEGVTSIQKQREKYRFSEAPLYDIRVVPSATSLRTHNSRGVSFEWGSFNDFFQVFSTNQREAREIVTPDFMAAIYDWWKEHKRNIRVVLKGSAFYVAIPARRMFSPSISGTDRRYKADLKLEFNTLQLAEQLVTILAEQRRLRRRD